jgi:signal transduction histidine kinase
MNQRMDDSASHRLLTLTEEQLSRIVLDIHDGPVQYLFTALSLITQLQQEIDHEATRATLVPRLARIATLLESSLYEIKFCIGTFRPPEFHRRTLESVLQGLVIQHEEWTGSTVELSMEPLPSDVSLAVKIALYRILQEALSNAYKHAGVETHHVRLWSDGTNICMEVTDNGTGFTPPEMDDKTSTGTAEHLGIRGMRDRISLLGGKFELQSQPGEGTRVTVRVPAHV